MPGSALTRLRGRPPPSRGLPRLSAQVPALAFDVCRAGPRPSSLLHRRANHGQLLGAWAGRGGAPFPPLQPPVSTQTEGLLGVQLVCPSGDTMAPHDMGTEELVLRGASRSPDTA